MFLQPTWHTFIHIRFIFQRILLTRNLAIKILPFLFIQYDTVPGTTKFSTKMPLHNIYHINKQEQETRIIMASYSSLSSSAWSSSSSSSSTMHSRSNSSSSNVGGGDNSFELFENDTNSHITNTTNSRRLSTSPTRRKTSALFKAMITSNNLRNCHEVEEIVAQCIQDSRSRTNQPPQSSHVCETAFNLYKNKNSGCRR